MTPLAVAEIASPVGPLVAGVRDGRLVALEFAHRWASRLARLERRFGPLALRPAADPAGVVRRFAAYLAGALDALAPVVIDPGGTAFQRRVWGALRDIPPGRTVSYQTLARAVGAPSAARAVGAANGANPIAVVIPCHRVTSADGRLVGYAGGVERKGWLLAHEGAFLTRAAAPPG